ncbi:PAS domain S-box/diguanylate cyclase (GGDEF) domain-containing protein [Desulfocapsa sulfexigens DSM 10523]|uniref:PAS domain S-box/diguanylate cyclase (GGDEF) domain-containing protein n=1 Tax=Desulfocapsa sulfexigens (strain DSM 10523 / SB164P1) TaxID=1167006 RepID=M1NG65_DESSD|nr:diguanylate cyclase [Desulfocapsa sulfexigens]AGF78649.1 PAS domain S-box/diguanylate cyclase (GGDEF) domain-containing protein [Desulfocapsa sulfexigens DSM 10523]
MITFARQLSFLTYLLLFILLQFILAGLLSYGKKQVLYSYQQQFSSELETVLEFTLSHYRDLSNSFFQTEVNQPPILSFMEQAGGASEEDKISLRQNLFAEIQPMFMLVKNDFLHLHFHLPNGDSFLRMHKPELFGDNLLQTRESIRLVAQEQQFLEGFEMGRHFYAFRYLYPLFNAEKKFLGSAEIGISFQQFRKSLQNLSKGRYQLLVKEEIAEKKLVAEGKANFQPSFLNSRFFIQKSDLNTEELQNHFHNPDGIPPAVMNTIDNKIKNHTEKLLQGGEAFNVTTKVDGQTYLVSFLPIKNITNSDIGYLAWYSRDTNFSYIERGYIISYFIGSVLIFIILFLYRWSTNKIFFQLTQLKEAEKELGKSHAEMEQIFNTAADGMRVVDKDHNVLRVNGRFLHMSDMEKQEVLALKCYEVFGGPSCMGSNCPLERIVSEGEEWIEYESVKEFSNGRKIPFIITATPYRNSNNKVIGIIEDFKDISDRKEFEQQLKKQARTDPLTGLMNRRGFIRSAEKMLRLAKRQKNILFLLFADLDNMKHINDEFGHEKGDLVLQETAKLLMNTYRETDIIGRLGGDEFAVLLFDVSAKEKENIVDRFQDNLSQWRKNSDETFSLSLSIGVVQSHPEKEEDMESLLRLADQAMYKIKRQRKTGKV